MRANVVRQIRQYHGVAFALIVAGCISLLGLLLRGVMECCLARFFRCLL